VRGVPVDLKSPTARCGSLVVRHRQLLQVDELRHHPRLQLTVWRGHSCPRLLTLILLVNWKPARPSGAEPQRFREGHG